MIKLLIIGYSDVFGGTEQFIREVVEGIDKSKISIDLLVYRNVPKDQLDKFKELGVRAFFVPQVGKHPVSFLLKIFEYYQRHQYQVIHINSSHAVSIMYVLPLWFTRKSRVIFHSHNASGDKKILHLIFKAVIRLRVDYRLACSIPASRYMFGKGKKVTIVRNAIDLNKYKFDKKIRNIMRAKMACNENTFVLGNIGRLAEQKNQKFIIDILAALKKDIDNIKLVLVGAGPLEQELIDYASIRGLAGEVLFVGAVSNPQDWYQLFDVFVLPSLYEGFPFTGVEAQANGLPVFFSNHVTSEIGLTENVFFLDLNSGPQLWAEKIKKFADGSKVERDKGIDVLKSKGYDINDMVKEIEEIYLKIGE